MECVKVRLHYIQHVPFEDLANIWQWTVKNGHQVSRTCFYKFDRLPNLEDFDLLVIMGGPMSVIDVDRFPWLNAEIEFIEKAIANDKIILGICLGAQLISKALGANVYKNDYKEIGWFNVKLTDDGLGLPLLHNIPTEFTTFHWHGDTFNIPNNSTHIAMSDGCLNQAFIYKDQVIGLQFHLECNYSSINKLIQNCSSDISNDIYIQKPNYMTSQKEYLIKNKKYINSLMDNIFQMF